MIWILVSPSYLQPPRQVRGRRLPQPYPVLLFSYLDSTLHYFLPIFMISNRDAASLILILANVWQFVKAMARRTTTTHAYCFSEAQIFFMVKHLDLTSSPSLLSVFVLYQISRTSSFHSQKRILVCFAQLTCRCFLNRRGQTQSYKIWVDMFLANQNIASIECLTCQRVDVHLLRK